MDPKFVPPNLYPQKKGNLPPKNGNLPVNKSKIF